MTFYNRSMKKETLPAPAGEAFETEYIEKIDNDGNKILEECGKTNIYEKIQAAHESTKIYNIIKRYEGGDETALNRIQGIYADVTGMPKSLMEAHQKIEQIEIEFGKLPLEIRKEFNHNPSEFIARMANGDGNEIIQKYAQKHIKKEEPANTDPDKNAQDKGDNTDE